MSFFELSFGGFFIRLAELLGGPFKEPNMLWIALPLMASLIIMELNTGTSRRSFWKDTHDVKQAFPHAIVLFFVAMDLLRRTFEVKSGFAGTIFSGMFLAAFVVLLMSVFIFLFDYYLEFPRNTYLGLTAHLPINTFAYLCVTVSYLQTGFDLNSILALVAFTSLLGFLIFFVKKVDTGDNRQRSSSRDNYTPRGPSKTKAIFEDHGSSYPPKRTVSKSQTKQENESDTVDLSQSNLTWFKK